MQDSLKMATDKISLDEIKQAKDQELINQGELIEFVKNKRLQEMKINQFLVVGGGVQKEVLRLKLDVIFFFLWRGTNI
jgi:hypothetical protein